MATKDELEKRKRKDFPRFVAIDVMDDRAAWAGRVLEMERFCREKVGVNGYAKQGRMGAERASLEFRFKSAEAAAEFQATFGGQLGAEQTKAPQRKKPRRSGDTPGDARASAVSGESIAATQRRLAIADHDGA